MSSTNSRLEDRIRLKVERGEFLSQLLLAARDATHDVQADFIEKLSTFSKSLRALFSEERLVIKLQYRPSEFWPSISGQRICFVDGGVARIELPSAAPMGIRVGTYQVRVGDRSDNREDFKVDIAIADELFDPKQSSFDDTFEDVQKLTDAARIVSEVAAVVRAAESTDPPNLVVLHGPLVNPAAPYGTPGFPSFTDEMCDALCGKSDAPRTKSDKHFVVVYKQLLERLIEASAHTIGIIERNQSSRATFISGLLKMLVDNGHLDEADANQVMERIKEYQLSDATLLSVILEEGEALAPIGIDRQQPKAKWPKDWETQLSQYPKAITTYLKSSENADPIRVESVKEGSISEDTLHVVLHTTRLLPRYGFPVGLDIVDKYAKVPAWMSRGIRQQHAVMLLNKALKSGNASVVEFAKRVVASHGRDWFFRPKP